MNYENDNMNTNSDIDMNINNEQSNLANLLANGPLSEITAPLTSLVNGILSTNPLPKEIKLIKAVTQNLSVYTDETGKYKTSYIGCEYEWQGPGDIIISAQDRSNPGNIVRYPNRNTNIKKNSPGKSTGRVTFKIEYTIPSTLQKDEKVIYRGTFVANRNSAVPETIRRVDAIDFEFSISAVERSSSEAPAKRSERVR